MSFGREGEGMEWCLAVKMELGGGARGHNQAKWQSARMVAVGQDGGGEPTGAELRSGWCWCVCWAGCTREPWILAPAATVAVTEVRGAEPGGLLMCTSEAEHTQQVLLSSACAADCSCVPSTG